MFSHCLLTTTLPISNNWCNSKLLNVKAINYNLNLKVQYSIAKIRIPMETRLLYHNPVQNGRTISTIKNVRFQIQSQKWYTKNRI